MNTFFIKNLTYAILVFFPLNLFSANPDFCWCDTNYTTYQEWMDQGKVASSSKKKICCYSKAIARAANASQKAEAYYQRGYATYYYMLDVMGETWDESGTGSGDNTRIIDENGGAAITEEALVPRDKRREDGYKDYVEALKWNSNHSDALYESGVYWYWKAYRENAKDDPNTVNVRNWYNRALSFFTACIQRDKWCSTAYCLRSRVREALSLSGKDRDIQIRDILRKPDPATTGSGLSGFYFWNKNMTDLKKTRQDSTINFNWGDGGPGDVGENNFSIRWIGLVDPPSDGSYMFTTYSDDGVKLWVDYKLVIDQWNDHGGTFHNSSSVSLKKGRKVAVKLEFYEHGGSAIIKLYWTPPGGSRVIIPSSSLYPIPEPSCAQFPKLWQHGLRNTTGWNLQLDKGNYGIVTGDYNDSLSSLIVTELYDATIYQHSYSGHYLNISGPYTISSLSNYSMDKNHSWNDTVSSAIIRCKSGFGE